MNFCLLEFRKIFVKISGKKVFIYIVRVFWKKSFSKRFLNFMEYKWQAYRRVEI